MDRQGGEDSALNRGEVLRSQTGSNIPPAQKNTIEPPERDAGEHISLGPHVPLEVEEWISANGDQVMGDCTKRNHQAQAGVATARRHDHYVPALHHLRRLKASGEVADQDRTGAWMERDGISFSSPAL